jgi:hypothetical protein
MRKILYVVLALFLGLQLAVIFAGCAGKSSSTPTTGQMSGVSAISVVVKDAVTGAKVPMTGVFVNSASLKSASIKASATLPGWSETKTNNMGYAEVKDVSADATVMIKIDNSASSYEPYSKVITTGKNIGGYTIYITTNEALAPAYDTAYDPTLSTTPSSGAVACNDTATCMRCGCPATGAGCGGGCACTDPATNCGGGNCRSASGVTSFGKCTETGCPTGCKNCGSCACSSGTGGCGGSLNCVVTSLPGGTGTSDASGACKDGACPPGCSGCGACVCTAAGGCGGKTNCLGGSVKPFPSSGGGTGKCTDSGCPPDCRNCGSCACSTAGNCKGSANCVSGSGGGSPTGGGGGSTGPGCKIGRAHV